MSSCNPFGSPDDPADTTSNMSCNPNPFGANNIPVVIPKWGMIIGHIADQLDLIALFEGYSVSAHDHDDRYSLLAHTHTFASLTGKPTTLAGYGITDSVSQAELDALNFDGDYAAIDHDHDDRYSLLTHDHAGVYSPVGHNHDVTYALIGHDHNGVYALIGHNHDLDYADIAHDHDADYAPLVHTHDDRYYTETEVDALIAGVTTTPYTNENAQDAIGAAIAAGTHVGITINYDDVANKFDFTSTITQYTNELAQDAIGAALAAGTHTGITVNYDDAGNAISLTNTITQYTDEMAQDALAAAFAAGTHTGITVTYNDGTNKIDLASTITQYTDELAQDAIGNILTDTGLAVVTYNDAGPSIDVNVPAALGADYRTGTDATKALTSDAVWDAAAYVTLNDSGGNIAVDLASGINFSMTMDGDYTLSAPTNGKPGQTGCIVLTQDGTGTQTLAYNAAWKFAGGTDPVLSTAASTMDILFYQVLPNGTDVFANLVKAVG